MKVAPPGSGPNRGRLPHAGELFTDREPESVALKEALARFRGLIDGGHEVGIDRHNVLMYYGMGGIGKTALSQRLELWVTDDLPLDAGWGPRPATKVDATVRIDLHGSAGQMDILAALLALRSRVGPLRTRWPVFDLAFTAYWSAVNPAEPLPEFGGASQGGDMVGETVGNALADLGDLADLAVGGPAGLGVRGVRKLIGELRRRRDLRLGIDAFEGFERFLMRCADEPGPSDPRPDLACELAGALSWELTRGVPAPLVVTFIDTTERLNMDPRRIAEEHLSTLIYQMPNVLFVLTGREMLDWCDARRTHLSFRGPNCWPGLVPGTNEEPRQHLVGTLSPADARSVVLNGRLQMNLPMDDEIVDEVVKASAGLPQYLELARQVAISIKDVGDGSRVRVEDVTGSLDSLVMRVMADVPQDEQRVIRAGCLFRMFDVELVAVAANVDNGCAERAVARPMIDHYVDDRFPYRIHDAVRKAIRDAGPHIAGGWSERDWQLAASRAASAVRRLHDVAKEQENNRQILDAVGIAVQLVCEQQTTLEPSTSETYRDWLARAIIFAPSIQGLRSRVPSTSKTSYGQHVLDFIISKSIETPAEERLRLLRRVFDSDHPLRLPAGRHLGYTLKAQQRWDEALVAFDELVAVDPSAINVRQGPMVLSMARRFADARARAETVDNSGYLLRVAEYAHGCPERYFADIEAKIDRLRNAGRQREQIEEIGDLVVRRAFFRGDVSSHELAKFRDAAEEAGQMVAVRSSLLATVLLPESCAETTTDALHRLKAMDIATSMRDQIGFRYSFAEFCDAALRQDEERLLRLRDTIEGISPRSRSWIPVECFLLSTGLSLTPEPTQWLESPGVVAERWGAHLHDYLARRTAATELGSSPG